MVLCRLPQQLPFQLQKKFPKKAANQQNKIGKKRCTYPLMAARYSFPWFTRYKATTMGMSKNKIVKWRVTTHSVSIFRQAYLYGVLNSFIGNGPAPIYCLLQYNQTFFYVALIICQYEILKFQPLITEIRQSEVTIKQFYSTRRHLNKPTLIRNIRKVIYWRRSPLCYTSVQITSELIAEFSYAHLIK